MKNRKLADRKNTLFTNLLLSMLALGLLAPVARADSTVAALIQQLYSVDKATGIPVDTSMISRVIANGGTFTPAQVNLATDECNQTDDQVFIDPGLCASCVDCR